MILNAISPRFAMNSFIFNLVRGPLMASLGAEQARLDSLTVVCCHASLMGEFRVYREKLEEPVLDVDAFLAVR